MGRPGVQLTGFILSWMSMMALDDGLRFMSTLIPDDLQIYSISYGQFSRTASDDSELVFGISFFLSSCKYTIIRDIFDRFVMM